MTVLTLFIDFNKLHCAPKHKKFSCGGIIHCIRARKTCSINEGEPPPLVRSIQEGVDGTKYAKGPFAIRKQNPVKSYAVSKLYS